MFYRPAKLHSLGGAIASDQQEPWAVILAGGEGARLRPLTQRIAGDERPKQFCPLLCWETLLEQTCRRTALQISPHRTLVVVTHTHERFYTPLLADVPSCHLVIQPANRGTTPAIFYALLRLATLDPTAPVAILPSDHYLSDEEAFMAYVAAALEAVRARPDLVILLGVTPDSPEGGYGWIELADPLVVQGWCTLYGVRRFWEKPSLAVAQTLLTQGCLWNIFVLVARVPALCALITSALPDLDHAFGPIRPTLNTLAEGEAVRALYARLPSTDFSKQVLTAEPTRLAVLPVSGVGWNDLGEPHRVLATQRQMQRASDAGPQPWEHRARQG